jgi:hypothetical protein
MNINFLLSKVLPIIWIISVLVAVFVLYKDLSMDIIYAIIIFNSCTSIIKYYYEEQKK